MIRRSKNLVILVSVVAIMVGVLVLPAIARVRLSFNVVIPSPYLEIDPEESHMEDMLFLNMCAQHFGFDVQILAPLWPRFTYPQISMICLLARESDTPISVIVHLREEGLGWKAICQRLGIYPTVWDEIGMWGEGEDYDDICIPVFVEVCHDYYDVPTGVIWDMYHRRYPWGEIVMSSNTARISHQPLERVLTWRSRKMPWNQIGPRAGITPYQFRRPLPSTSTMRYRNIIKPPQVQMGPGFFKGQGGKPIIMRQGNLGGGIKMGGNPNFGRGRGKGH